MEVRFVECQKVISHLPYCIQWPKERKVQVTGGAYFEVAKLVTA